jgi:hypothetical protein
MDSLIALPGTGGVSAVVAKAASLSKAIAESINVTNERVHADSSYNPKTPNCNMRGL